MILFPLSYYIVIICFVGNQGYLWFHLQIFGMLRHASPFRPQGQGTEVCSPSEDASSKVQFSGWVWNGFESGVWNQGETLAKMVAFPTPPKKGFRFVFISNKSPAVRWDSMEFFHKENPASSLVFLCNWWAPFWHVAIVCFHLFLLSDQGCDSNGCCVSNEFCSMPQLFSP